ncbi:hypothetical protein [Serratia ureilytica]|uniref:hypothetical protein n=1 Tax=Serratia ureilytica TaxID=300181 RepID=UPI0018D991B3|nr:hypothetical protein [Serratia ureilytica]MBH3008157.1 hypothetical protein [Serratia ureilytica]MBH3022829.1 hypothetical protein [Serratia ureilytica]MBH3108708.1 hypothetical protein [Serratia ureilytica]MBH3176102.1 hypothetical protein [Serratia ureilytica]QQU62275.1 hypothetical protein I6I46_19645 [Serratia ureilytica]
MLKLKSKPALLFILSIITFITVISLSYKKRLILSCSTELTIKRSTGGLLHANASYFMYNNGTGFVTYKGVIKENGVNYIINRDTPFIISDKDNDGIATLEYQGVVKKKNDSLPENQVWNTLYGPGEKYYFSFYKTKSDDYTIQEVGRTGYYCSN